MHRPDGIGLASDDGPVPSTSDAVSPVDARYDYGSDAVRTNLCLIHNAYAYLSGR